MTGLCTALIGFGKISQGYSQDSRMKSHFSYATHAEVLRDHPSFSWQAVVDIDQNALINSQTNWGVPEIATHVSQLACLKQIEVAVIATQPDFRREVIESMPSLKAIIVEKPLALTLKAAQDFLDLCRQRNILVQVNLIRRADETMQQLASGGLAALIGAPQGATVHYGNGLLNNGTHMIDLCRMLLGEISELTAFTAGAFDEGPLPADKNFSVVLQADNDALVNLQPLRFSKYRENSLDIWGETGRLAIMQEGLTMLQYQVAENRSLERTKELVSETPISHKTKIGIALYNLYSNLADAIDGKSGLCSSGESALKTASVVEAAFHSYQGGGTTVYPKRLLAPITDTQLVS
jgi:predicted dehydrogenase